MSIIFRRLLPHESLLYRSVRLDCLKNDTSNFGSTFEEEAASTSLKFEDIIQKDLQDSFMVGAFDKDVLIGIAGFDRMNRRRTRHRGNVEQVYIKGDYRGKNIGERLLKKLIGEAFALEGVEQLHLGVIIGNKVAIALYEKLGFRTFGIHPQYFKFSDKYLDQQFMQLFKGDYLG